MFAQKPVAPVGHDAIAGVGEQLVDLPDMGFDAVPAHRPAIAVELARDLLARDADVTGALDQVEDRCLVRRQPDPAAQEADGLAARLA